MKNYKLILNEDVTKYVDLYSTQLDECYEEALSVLGWSILEQKTEQLDDCSDQLTFGF